MRTSLFVGTGTHGWADAVLNLNSATAVSQTLYLLVVFAIRLY